MSKFYSDSNSEKVRDAFKNVTCTAKKGKVTFNHSIAGVNHTAQCLPEATTKKPSVDGSEVGVSSINNSTYYALIGLGVFMIICVVIAVCFPIRSLC